ncbi:putative thioesterase, Rhodanese-like domain, phosphopantetheine binding ACP [Septoria linicola]|nr:putative thioesterase, Rhodanese-like domain, phosphopantetheine binding ACP [Septoria linicola]
MTMTQNCQYQRTIDILCQECLTPREELTNDTAMADLLTDPLLSVAISTRLKKELQLEVSAEDLVNLRAISDLKSTLLRGQHGGPSLSVDPSSNQWSAASSRCSTPAEESTQPWNRMAPAMPSRRPSYALTSTSAATPMEEIVPWKATSTTIEVFTPMEDVAPETLSNRPTATPSAKSVVLQGRPEDACRAVFLFPDGSGSERSYTSLPRIALDVVVYGLQSPYLKCPADMHCTWDELVETFVAEIRKCQPRGPYDFGGYAAGGALAFRAAQILVAQGEEIHSLTLINAPVPEVLGQLSDELYEYIRSIRAWRNGGRTPEWVLPHLKAFTRVLNTYRQSRCGLGAVRNVKIQWAGRGVSQDSMIPPSALTDGERTVIKFLTEARTDFGPCGWEVLLPGSNISCGRIDADHFEIMSSECSPQISMCIAEALQ